MMTRREGIALQRSGILSVVFLLTTAPVFAEEEDPAPASDPETTEATETAEEPEAEAPEEPRTLVRRLSWDAMAGLVPTAPIIHAEMGFSGLPRVAYHHGLGNGLSIGGLVAFDYGYWAPKWAFSPALVVAGVARYSVLNDPESTMTVAVRGEPGVFLGLDADVLGILLNVGASVGFTLENRFIVGGGVDIPVMLGIPTTSGSKVNLSVPILFGPVAEFHLTPPLAVTFDAKVGPHLNSFGGVFFGFRAMVGVAYRL